MAKSPDYPMAATAWLSGLGSFCAVILHLTYEYHVAVNRFVER